MAPHLLVLFWVLFGGFLLWYFFYFFNQRFSVNREITGKEEEENLNDPRVNCFAVNTEIQSKTHLMGSIFYYTMLNN